MVEVLEVGGGGGGMLVEDGARQERSGQESVSSELSVLRQCSDQ